MKFVGISRTSSENVNICGEMQKIENSEKIPKISQNPETDEIIHSFEWIIQSSP